MKSFTEKGISPISVHFTKVQEKLILLGEKYAIEFLVLNKNFEKKLFGSSSIIQSKFFLSLSSAGPSKFGKYEGDTFL